MTHLVMPDYFIVLFFVLIHRFSVVCRLFWPSPAYVEGPETPAGVHRVSEASCTCSYGSVQ